MEPTYNEENRDFRLGDSRLDTVTEILVSSGLIDVSHFTEEGRTRGSYVHTLTEHYDRDIYDPAEAERLGLSGYMAGWIAFRKDSANNLTLIDIEKRVHSEPLLFCGKPDRTAVFNGKKTILDIKTGPSTPTIGIQLAAYAYLLRGPWERISVHLSPSGKYKLQKWEDPTDITVWFSAVSLSRWKRTHGIK